LNLVILKQAPIRFLQIAQERQAYLTNDALNDPHIIDKEWARREHMVAFAGYPLLVEDQVVGVKEEYEETRGYSYVDTVKNDIPEFIPQSYPLYNIYELE
jgi:hypothetical protein